MDTNTPISEIKSNLFLLAALVSAANYCADVSASYTETDRGTLGGASLTWAHGGRTVATLSISAGQGFMVVASHGRDRARRPMSSFTNVDLANLMRSVDAL